MQGISKMASVHTLSQAGLVVALLLMARCTCHVGHKEGVRIETIVSPSPGCYKLQSGDFFVTLENITLTDGTVLHTSYLPDGKVVTKRSYLGKRTNGINVGMLGACKGEVRHLTIPPQLMMGSVQDTENLAASVPVDVQIHYRAEILDVVPQTERALLQDFLSTDKNGDYVVRANEIERVLEMERDLKLMLQKALGMDNIVELAVQWFDSDGDGGLNREEYFTLSQTIQLDQMRKDAKAQYPDEYRNPEKNRALKDEF